MAHDTNSSEPRPLTENVQLNTAESGDRPNPVMIKLLQSALAGQARQSNVR